MPRLSVPSPAAVVRTVSSAGLELLGARRARRSWSGHGRAWIEVRGIDAQDGHSLADAVAAEVRAMPGVRWAETNRPLARLVVECEPEGPSLEMLCERVSAVEHRFAAAVRDENGDGSPRSADLPCDSAMVTGRLAALGADAVGLGLATAGRVLRWPRLPGAAVAAVVLIDSQPRIRRVVEGRLGAEVADVVLATATAAAQAFAQGPASLTVDLVLRTLLVAEARAAQRAWHRDEPMLATSAGCAGTPTRSCRPRAVPPGPIERYSDVASAGGLAAAAAIGLSSGGANAAADAVLVAAPRATRAAREAFVASFAAGLNDRCGSLVLRPSALRRLDRIDALVLDPRALVGSELSVAEVRGIEGTSRTRVWQAAGEDVSDGLLGPGWHPLSALSPAHELENLPADVRVLISPLRDPLAEVLIAAARAAELEVTSLDVPELGTLRSAFDNLAKVEGDLDAALCEAVRDLQRAGRCVAVFGAVAPRAFENADLAVALLSEHHAVAWTADVLVPDLTVAWRIMIAVPAARRASRRGVELAAGGAVLGGLLMLPGVRGRGPGPVAAAAAAGLVEGRAGALRVLRRVRPQASPAVSWHALSVQQVLDAAPEVVADVPTPARELPLLDVAGTGLRVSRDSVRSALRIAAAFRTELSDPLTPVLAVGAAASAVLGSPVDAVLVTSVVAANAALSTFQRLRAEQQLQRLLVADAVPARRLAARTFNDDWASSLAGVSVAASTLRVGDTVVIRAGDVVPADARIVKTDGLEVDESSLTGESLPVAKSTQETPGAPLAERSCMVYEGTTVLTGSGIGLVTAVGASSAAGRAAALAPGTAVGRGLQAQLGTLTAKVLPLTLAAGGAVTLTSVLRGAGLRQAVSSGVSIAVAAVPEGLPLVATLAQQAAARRLTDRDILVRTPRAVEGLGRVSVVCFDKTGTLSQNRLRVSALHVADGATSDQLLQAAGLATQLPQQGQALSHATDAAVLDALDGTLLARDRELPFRPGRPYAAGISGDRLAVKGAPETILAACELTEAQRTGLAAELARLAGAGLRILAVAERPLTIEEHDRAVGNSQDFEKLATVDLRLLGLLGLADTPRPDAKALLAGLRSQGVGVRLITGDHPMTAAAISAELGLPARPEEVLTGADWENLSHRGRAEAVERVLVFARMSPEHKVQIVQELQRAGHVCAMVGDGANDAAAIRTAAVGIGVSTHGSDPARGAADIVLTDGKILPLLSALDEGQQMWHRVQAALAVLLGGNAGEVAFTLYGTALTGTAPLNARQLLLVNMLTDALPAAAVAVSPPAKRTRSVTRGLDTDALIASVLTRGATTTVGASAGWTMARLTGRRRRASTVGLVALVSTQLGQTLLDSHSPLVIVTAAGSLAALAAAVSTPGVSHLLGCTPLGPVGWTQALGSAAAATAMAAIAPQVIERVAAFGRMLGDDVSNPNSNKQGVQTANGRQEHYSQYAGQAFNGETIRD